MTSLCTKKLRNEFTFLMCVGSKTNYENKSCGQFCEDVVENKELSKKVHNSSTYTNESSKPKMVKVLLFMTNFIFKIIIKLI